MAAARSANERKMFVYQKERYMWWCDEGREKPSEVGNSKKKKHVKQTHTPSQRWTTTTRQLQMTLVAAIHCKEINHGRQT